MVKTIADFIEEVKVRKDRRQLLVDTVNELLDDKVVSWKHLVDILWVTNQSVIYRIKRNELSMSAKKVEEYLEKIITE